MTVSDLLQFIFRPAVELFRDLPLRKKDRGPLSWYFVATLLVILAYGLVILFSASYSLSYQETGDSLSQIRQQVIFAAVGVAAMFVIATLDYRALRHMTWYLYVLTLILLTAALFDENPTNLEADCYRWVQVFGVTFEQGRQELAIDDELISNIVTENKELSEEAKRDMKVSLIILKYTQSNSVCYVKDGQAIGVGAGQQSRVHCTRLAGQKADNWFLRQSPKVLNLPFKESISRAERDNAIDVYIGDEYMDVLADGNWEKTFTEKPAVFTKEEKRAWLDQMTDVTLGSDAFFPFSDNIERAYKSGVKYIAQPGGSVRDADVIDTCNKYNIAMAFTGIRLFHH